MLSYEFISILSLGDRFCPSSPYLYVDNIIMCKTNLCFHLIIIFTYWPAGNHMTICIPALIACEQWVTWECLALITWPTIPVLIGAQRDILSPFSPKSPAIKYGRERSLFSQPCSRLMNSQVNMTSIIIVHLSIQKIFISLNLSFNHYFSNFLLVLLYSFKS